MVGTLGLAPNHDLWLENARMVQSSSMHWNDWLSTARGDVGTAYAAEPASQTNAGIGEAEILQDVFAFLEL